MTKKYYAVEIKNEIKDWHTTGTEYDTKKQADKISKKWQEKGYSVRVVEA